jgi:FMN-dependent NADH-azoreductase
MQQKYPIINIYLLYDNKDTAWHRQAMISPRVKTESGIMDKRLNILRIDASGRLGGSSSRALSDDLVAALEARYGDVDVIRRDLAEALPHVDQDWIEANLTGADERSAEQRQKLALSDQLVNELRAADALVIGVPIYNFGVPAALKAWVDMICRARLTFRYTENGPEGLLQGKKAFLIVASGGVGVDSAVDFATPYMRQALKFVGIEDVEVIAADQQNMRGDEAISEARARIADIVHTTPSLRPSSQAA